MFIAFFYLLRERGLKVSLGEWMTLVEALEKGLGENSFSKFYTLCRAILVKSEADYDIFDNVFYEYFKDVPFIDELPEELLAWLNSPDHEKEDLDMRKAWENEWLTNDEIRKKLKERLEEQDSEHNGGTYWIGAHGLSVMGNGGASLKGIRVGGVSQYQRALDVAGERRFRDFRRDQVIEERDYQVAFRSLRQYSNQMNLPKTELDLDATVQGTANRAGLLDIVFEKPRKNSVKLLLLMDSGGSMEIHSKLMASLFQAVNKASHFSDLKVYYFHNCIRKYVYKSPTLHYRERVTTKWLMDNLDSSYRVIFVGDALMDNGELFDAYHFGEDVVPSGMETLQLLKKHYPRMVWLNPRDMGRYQSTLMGWGASLNIIRNEVNMYPLTKEGLELGIKKLLVNK